MKKSLLITTTLLIVFSFGTALAQNTIFGPKQYTRTEGKPNLYMDTFASGEEGREAKFKISNGDPSGKYRISSARVIFNGEQVFGPNNFNQKVDSLEAFIRLTRSNSVSVELRSGEPGSYISVEIILPFMEGIPAWRMPELAVTNLTVSPERSDPGETVTIRATVANIARGNTPKASLVFTLDGVEISRASVNPLGAGEKTDFTTTWPAAGAGNHQVRAELEVEEGGFDGSFYNNFQIAVARVSGEVLPKPELELTIPNLDALKFIPGEAPLIPIKVRNPSFATIDIPISFYIDGEFVKTDFITNLGPGQETEFQVLWNNVTEGEHTLTAYTYTDYTFTYSTSDDDIEFPAKVVTWHLVVAGPTVLYDVFEKDKWVSIGPRILENGWAGRMNAIAFHPDPEYPNIIYAGGAGFGSEMGIFPAAGVWKTVNWGESWFPIGDKLPSMLIGSIAVDPMNPDIVYAGGRGGIFKSMDGGTMWWHFVNSSIAYDVRKIIVRYTSSGQVMIYIQCQQGVLRYKSTDLRAIFSEPWEWVVIKKGTIRDLAIHPMNSSILYASVTGDGIYRTIIGEVAEQETNCSDRDYADQTSCVNGGGTWGSLPIHDWTKLLTGLPSLTSPDPEKKQEVTLDIHKIYPTIIYAGITYPEPGIYFTIYRGTNGGDNWDVVKKYAIGELDDAIYNPYIRVVPKQATETYLPEVIYFGGVYLYQFINYLPLTSQAAVPQGGTFQVSGSAAGEKAGVDLKALEFYPANQEIYYSLGDQGIFLCSVLTTPKQWTLNGKKFGESGDQCNHRNNDLRVTEFYDFDVSKTDPNLIIGGTQDTGTIRYNGDPNWKWKMVVDGDGMYSLINPHNDSIMYRQHQTLDSTVRSEDGGDNWPISITTGHQEWLEWLKDIDGYSAYITMDPRVPDSFIATWNRKSLLYMTYVGGGFTPQSYLLSNYGINDLVTHLIVRPTDYLWIMGTSTGKIYYVNAENPDGLIFFQVFAHENELPVLNLSVSPKDPNWIFATFDCPRCLPERIQEVSGNRIWLVPLFLNETPYNITSGFPLNLTPRVIVGDAHDQFKAYVGTDKGVWQWDGTASGGMLYWDWKPYNDGFPLTTVVDLIVDSDKNLLAATKGRGAWRVITGP